MFHYHKWFSFSNELKIYIISCYLKGKARLTNCPKKIDPDYWIAFVPRGFNINSEFYNDRLRSLVRLPPRNCAVFESQFLAECCTERAKNSTDYLVSQALWMFGVNLSLAWCLSRINIDHFISRSNNSCKTNSWQNQHTNHEYRMLQHQKIWLRNGSARLRNIFTLNFRDGWCVE